MAVPVFKLSNAFQFKETCPQNRGRIQRVQNNCSLLYTTNSLPTDFLKLKGNG